MQWLPTTQANVYQAQSAYLPPVNMVVNVTGKDGFVARRVIKAWRDRPWLGEASIAYIEVNNE